MRGVCLFWYGISLIIATTSYKASWHTVEMSNQGRSIYYRSGRVKVCLHLAERVKIGP